MVHFDEPIPEGGWREGLCGCLSSIVPNCCMTYFFPCVTFAQVEARIGRSSYGAALGKFLLIGIFVLVGAALCGAGRANSTTNEDGTVTLSVVYFIGYGIWVLALFAELYLLCSQRSFVRTKFGIEGNSCFDCLTVYFCPCCSLSQVATHVASYESGHCRLGSPPLYTGAQTMDRSKV